MGYYPYIFSMQEVLYVKNYNVHENDKEKRKKFGSNQISN